MQWHRKGEVNKTVIVSVLNLNQVILLGVNVFLSSQDSSPPLSRFYRPRAAATGIIYGHYTIQFTILWRRISILPSLRCCKCRTWLLLLFHLKPALHLNRRMKTDKHPPYKSCIASCLLLLTTDSIQMFLAWCITSYLRNHQTNVGTACIQLTDENNCPSTGDSLLLYVPCAKALQTLCPLLYLQIGQSNLTLIRYLFIISFHNTFVWRVCCRFLKVCC